MLLVKDTFKQSDTEWFKKWEKERKKDNMEDKNKGMLSDIVIINSYNILSAEYLMKRSNIVIKGTTLTIVIEQS